MQHDSIKLSTEALVSDAFVVYRGFNPSSCRAGNVGEPDRVCLAADGSLFGVELASGWYSPQDAGNLRKIVTDLARDGTRQTIMSSSGMTDEDLPPGVIRNPDEKLAVSLQAALESHCRKRYGIPTYLVLDGSWAPITTASDAPKMLAGLRLPSPCLYVGVFLCLARNYAQGRVFFEVPGNPTA